MNYTEEQLENLADAFRLAGYSSEEITDNDTWAKLADCVLNGLGLIIKGKEDHFEQLGVLSNLMDNKIEEDSFQSNYLQLLALVLDDYENKHYNILRGAAMKSYKDIDKTTQDAPTEIIAYKVFNQDWTCRGFQFEVGKSYHQNGEIVPCDNGFHACVNLADCFGYYSFNPDNKVAKVRLYGTLASKEDKICASDIELLEELSWEKVLQMVNIGKGNSGNRNSGNRNSGDRNSGDYNSGYYNSGYYNSGYFNTNTPKTIRVFGVEVDRVLWERCPKPGFLYFSPTIWIDASEMSDQEKIDNPKFFTAGGYLKKIPYKQAFKESFEKASKEDRKLILGIPNFNKEMFYEISGINIDEYDLS